MFNTIILEKIIAFYVFKIHNVNTVNFFIYFLLTNLYNRTFPIKIRNETLYFL